MVFKCGAGASQRPLTHFGLRLILVESAGCYCPGSSTPYTIDSCPPISDDDYNLQHLQVFIGAYRDRHERANSVIGETQLQLAY